MLMDQKGPLHLQVVHLHLQNEIIATLRESHLLLFMELRNSMTICMDVLLLFAQITSLWRSC